MMRFGLGVLALLAASWITPAASLTVLARCGPSVGQSYYFESGLVGPGQGGWQKDGFDNGRILVWINDDNKLDVIVKDVAGVRSYTNQGYAVSAQAVDNDTRSFLVTASGDKFIETFLVKLNDKGMGSMVWTSSKTTTSFIKASIMLAECGPKFDLAP